jgi:hypothetical protein
LVVKHVLNFPSNADPLILRRHYPIRTELERIALGHLSRPRPSQHSHATRPSTASQDPMPTDVHPARPSESRRLRSQATMEMYFSTIIRPAQPTQPPTTSQPTATPTTTKQGALVTSTTLSKPTKPTKPCGAHRNTHTNNAPHNRLCVPIDLSGVSAHPESLHSRACDIAATLPISILVVVSQSL